MLVIIAQYGLKDVYMRFTAPRNMYGVVTRFMMVFYVTSGYMERTERKYTNIQFFGNRGFTFHDYHQEIRI